MKSSQAPYRACVLLEEASAEAAAAKRLWFVSFIFNFPIEMPEEKKKRPLPWRALQLWQRYLLQSRNRLVLGTAWPSTAQGAVVRSFFLYLLILSLNTGTSFKGCCRGLGFFFWRFCWWRAEQAPAQGSGERRESPSDGRLGCISRPVTRMPVMCCCSHKGPFLSLPGGFSITERTLSYKQKSNLCNCGVTDKTRLLYRFVQALWPLALVQQTSKIFRL